jgi:hypothetical protein
MGSRALEFRSWGAKLTTRFHLVLSLIMSGAITLLPLYVVMVWMDKYTSFYVIVLNSYFVSCGAVGDLSV